MDYAHAMTRLPELHVSLSEAAVPDAVEVQELETLTRSIPKLIGILPDVLSSSSDPRHKVALAEMISGLTAVLDQVKPLALVSHRSDTFTSILIANSLICSIDVAGTVTDPAHGSRRSCKTTAHPDNCLGVLHEVRPGVMTSAQRVCSSSSKHGCYCFYLIISRQAPFPGFSSYHFLSAKIQETLP